MGYQIQKNIFWVHIRVLWSSFPLHWKPNILLVNYDSWWQHQMSVRELRHDRPSGRFLKSRGLSASVSSLSSPPPPRSFTYAIFRAVFHSRSSFFAPKPHGNACYAGYQSLRAHSQTRKHWGREWESRQTKSQNNSLSPEIPRREPRNLRVPARVSNVESGAVFSKNSTFGYFDGTAWTPR